MMKKNINKKILFLFLTTIISIDTCFAAGVGFKSLYEGGGNAGDPEPEIPYSDWGDYPSDEHKYQYRYKEEINTTTKITINAYDLQERSLIPSNISQIKNYEFKSGTWVGINVTETNQASWKVYDFDYQEVKKEYTCEYTKKGSPYTCCYGSYKVIKKNVEVKDCSGDCMVWSGYPRDPSKGNCSTNAQTCHHQDHTITLTPKPIVAYNEEYSCPQTYPANGYSEYKLTKETFKEVPVGVTDANIITEMKKKAVKNVYDAAKEMVNGTNGSVKYITNHNYPKTSEDIVNKTITGGTPIKEEENGPTDNGNIVSGTILKYYEIIEKNVCMDVKTSVVTYGRQCKTTEGEMKINNGRVYESSLGATIDYWHYFIPLNTKSKSEFSLDIIKNESKRFSAKVCENFMKENENYKEYIVPYDETATFEGDYHRYRNKSDSTDYRTIYQSEKPGCNVAIKLSFPITQEFYREIEDDNGNIKFNGFNFYYKPINIKNPFPNELASTSIWKEWYEETNKEPNISKSYENITYSTKINASEIRNYTKDHPYTSWDNIDTTGISRFIEDYSIINRKNDQTIKSSIYKLACGPYNEDWRECD